jgi:hypothetical protein
MSTKNLTRVLSNPHLAYEYARDVIGGRFPQGEPVIAQDHCWSNRFETITFTDEKAYAWFLLRWG